MNMGQEYLFDQWVSLELLISADKMITLDQALISTGF